MYYCVSVIYIPSFSLFLASVYFLLWYRKRAISKIALSDSHLYVSGLLGFELLAASQGGVQKSMQLARVVYVTLLFPVFGYWMTFSRCLCPSILLRYCFPKTG